MPKLEHMDGAQPVLISVEGVAELLACSTRHVRRMADRGAMPQPVKIGTLVRWNRQQLDEWIRAGCPSQKKGSR